MAGSSGVIKCRAWCPADYRSLGSAKTFGFSYPSGEPYASGWPCPDQPPARVLDRFGLADNNAYSRPLGEHRTDKGRIVDCVRTGQSYARNDWIGDVG